MIEFYNELMINLNNTIYRVPSNEERLDFWKRLFEALNDSEDKLR